MRPVKLLSESELERRIISLPPARNFPAVLAQSQPIAIVAEVKKASPSAGMIRADFDPVAIARTYEAHGAAAISVLTDEQYFQGRLEYLSAVHSAVACPVLRKDFILDRYQLVEARSAGADAVLLIAECLPGDRLATLQRAGDRTGTPYADRASRCRTASARARRGRTGDWHQ